MPTKKTTKAEPTKVISENRDSSLKFYIALVAVAVVICSGAVFLGKSDTGAIDVTAAINNANQERRESNSDPANENNQVGEVPNVREVHRKLPNGGLVPAASQEEKKPAPTPEPAEDENSSTTEDGVEEGDETTAEEETQETPDESEASEETSEQAAEDPATE